MPLILLDTDPGVDDALALLYLHQHPAAELVGITTVAGNGTIEQVTRNALYLAERFGISAPIARGAAVPLANALHIPPSHIHGANALGDVPIEHLPQRPLDARPAHRLIAELIRERPGEITIVAVGMLTNVARAVMAAPDIVPLVARVVIMGGAFGTGGRYGNVRPNAEANIYGDPHAADIVLGAAWPLTIVGLDVTERVIMSTAYLEQLRAGGTDAGACIWQITRLYEAFHERNYGLSGIFSHDPSAAVCALDDSAFSFRHGPVRVATDGIAVGTTLQKHVGRVYPPNAFDRGPIARVAVDVDAARVLDDFAGTLLAAS